MKTEYTSTFLSEVNLDFQKVCTKCEASTRHLERLFISESVVTTSGLFSSMLAERRIQFTALAAAEKTAAVRDAASEMALYARCGACGFYGEDDIAKLRQAYPLYRKDSRRVFLILGVVCMAFMGWLAVATSDLPNYAGGLLAFAICLMIPLLVYAIIYWRKSKSNFEKTLSRINSPELTQKWLKLWEKKSKPLEGKILAATDTVLRIEPMGSLRLIRHRFDPFSPHYYYRKFGLKNY